MEWTHLISKATTHLASAVDGTFKEATKRQTAKVGNKETASGLARVVSLVPLLGRGAGARLTQNRASFFLDRQPTKARRPQVDPLHLASLKQKSNLKKDNPVHTLMALQKGLHSGAEVLKAYQKIERIIGQVKGMDLTGLKPQQKLKKVYQLIENQYHYVPTADFVEGILNGYLDCDTQGILVLAIAHEMEWPVHLVYAPQHAFLRWDDSKWVKFNMDLGGKVKSDNFYRKEFNISPEAEKKGVFLKNLTPRELNSHFYNLVGSLYSQKGKQNLAFSFYNRAVELDNNNIFAIGNRGNIYQAMNKNELALVDFARVYELDFQNPKNILRVAQLYYLQKKFITGVQFLLKIYPQLKQISQEKDPKKRLEAFFAELANHFIVYSQGLLSKGGQEKYLTAYFDLEIADELLSMLPHAQRNKYIKAILLNKYLLGKLCIEYKDYSKALNHFEEFLGLWKFQKILGSLPPKTVQILSKMERESFFYRGVIFLRSQDYPQAVKLFKELHQQEPQNLDYRFYLAKAYNKDEKYLKAIHHLIPIVKRLPQNFEALQLLGDSYFQNKDYQLARQIYSQIIKIKPNNTQARLNFAWAVSQNSWMGAKEAMKIFKAISVKEPKNPSALVGMAAMHDFLGEEPKAIELYLQVLKLSPSHYGAKLNLAWSYYNIKKYQNSERLYREIISVSPDLLQILNDLDKLNLEEIRVKGDKLSAYYKNSTTPILGLAYNFIRQGKFTKAKKLLFFVSGLNPSERYLDGLGWISLKQGKYQEAENFFNKSLKKGREDTKKRIGFYEDMCLKDTVDDAWALQGLGRIQLARGNPKKAKYYFDRVHALDPYDQEIQAELKKVKGRL